MIMLVSFVGSLNIVRQTVKDILISSVSDGVFSVIPVSRITLYGYIKALVFNSSFNLSSIFLSSGRTVPWLSSGSITLP